MTVWVDKGAEAVRTEIMKGLDTVIVTPVRALVYTHRDYAGVITYRQTFVQSCTLALAHDALICSCYVQMDEYTIYPRINETRCGVFEHGPNSLRAHKTGVGVSVA